MITDNEVIEALKHAGFEYQSPYLTDKMLHRITSILSEEAKRAIISPFTRENDWVRGAVIHEALEETDKTPVLFDIDENELNRRLLEILDSSDKVNKYHEEYKRLHA